MQGPSGTARSPRLTSSSREPATQTDFRCSSQFGPIDCSPKVQTPPSLPPEPPHPSLVYAAQPSRPYNPWPLVILSFGSSTLISTSCLAALFASIPGHTATPQF